MMLSAFFVSRQLAKWEDQRSAELLRAQRGLHTRFFVRDRAGDRERVT